jgi:hypothetical protein
MLGIGGLVLFTVCACLLAFLWADADPTGGRWCQFPFQIVAGMFGGNCP